MKCALRRNSYDEGRQEGWRIMLAGIALVTASVVWHTLQSNVVHWVARTNVGCCFRERLLTAGLRLQGEEVPTEEELSGAGATLLRTHTLPQPWVIVTDRVRHARRPNGSCTAAGWRDRLFDHALRRQGSLLNVYPVLPCDADGDGRWEVIVSFLPDERRNRSSTAVGWAVIRLGPWRNEIVWVALVDDSPWRTKGEQISAVWRDDDGDGIRDLVLTVEQRALRPGRLTGNQHPEVVGRFQWWSSGSALRVAGPTTDGRVAFWPPAASQPFSVDKDEDLISILRQLAATIDN